MDNRREFLKKAAMLSGAAGFFSLPTSIAQAMAINPEPGSTFYDAEHIVFLMQENRSFDHCFGALQGVRGFNDPRAINLPDGKPVWLQTNAAGESFAPFRLNIHETKSTWMGSLPHSWTNQVDARNNGKYDRWLDVKKSGHKEYAAMPLTMGYYNREDIPFYYALADAFTVCDQHFCSSLTGTTPNRLYFWTGTIRQEQHPDSKANVWNEEADYEHMVNWKTYPERLEENGISWKIYQNELSVEGGFSGEHDSWMANFGDNPIEYFTQFNVKLTNRYINYLAKASASLPKEIEALEKQTPTENLKKQIGGKKEQLKKVLEDKAIYTREKYDKLSAKEKALHEKAFVINNGDPDFYELTALKYQENGEAREINVPKGDVLHQFRKDVQNGQLPTVSWLVAPENYSDHPSSAWFGAWYLSECMDILTNNPAVWKKTIFVLTYDENDGYFDHQPPFVSPDPRDPASGKLSRSIDASTEFITMDQEKKRNFSERSLRESSIGLGYRVPLVIASPWSRGGWVNSEVFDHTSSLRFLENFLEKKTGKKVSETNISSWRKSVCGDLTSVFRKSKEEDGSKLKSVKKDSFIESVHKAKFKGLPTDYKKFSNEEIAALDNNPNFLAKQEPGTRQSCALPYELYVDGRLSADKKSFEIKMQAGNKTFGKRAAGSPFTVYTPGLFKNEKMLNRSYAVAAGEQVADSWAISDFDKGLYHLRVYGPNGFFREFKGREQALTITSTYKRNRLNGKILTGDLQVQISSKADVALTVEINDLSYGSGMITKNIEAGSTSLAILELTNSQGWYHFSMTMPGDEDYLAIYAGRVETGKASISDPAMGGAIA